MGLLQSGSKLIKRKRGIPDPYASYVALFLKADPSRLTTNTTTTANFTVPAVGATVTVDVVSSDWATANRAVRIGGGAGNYIITTVPNGTQITVRNCGGTDNASVGANISSGATIALSIIDSSQSNQIISAFGNAQLSTAQSKYTGSILLDGSGDYLTVPSSVGAFGTGDFTVETWFRLIASPSQQYIFDARNSNLLTSWAFGFGLNVPVPLDWYTGSTVYTISASISEDVFYHAAVSRVSGTLYLSRNGIITNILSDSTNYQTGAGVCYIGERYSSIGTSGYNGYLAPFRITQGVGRYTTDFDPETDTYLY